MANLTSKEWRDLIFENKNKEFGAYDLRKKSEKRHTLAVIFTLIGLAVIVLAVIGYSKFADWQAERQRELDLLEAEKMSQVDLGVDEEVPEEEEQEEQKFEQEIPEVPEEVLATVQVTQIAIVDADKVKNEVMTMEEQKENTTAVGVVNQEGGDNVDKLESVKEQVVVAPPEPPKPVVVEEKPKPVSDEVFSAVEQMPSFPGGDAALMTWLSKNISYPVRAQENGVEGRVIVEFVVEKDGGVSGVKVAKGVDKDLDQEAVRVVKKMPKWQPGKNNGQAVRTKYTLPVRFKLEK